MQDCASTPFTTITLTLGPLSLSCPLSRYAPLNPYPMPLSLSQDTSPEVEGAPPKGPHQPRAAPHLGLDIERSSLGVLPEGTEDPGKGPAPEFGGGGAGTKDSE